MQPSTPVIRFMRKSDEADLLDVFKSKRNLIVRQMLRKAMFRKGNVVVVFVILGLILALSPSENLCIWQHCFVYPIFAAHLLAIYYILEAFSFFLIIECGMAKELFIGCYEHYQQKGRAMLVAELSGRVVGIAAIDRENKEDECTWKRVAILPSCKRRGIGKLLVGELENLSRAFGYKRVVLETTDLHLFSDLLYVKVGFIFRSSYIYQWFSTGVKVGVYEKLLK